MVNSDKKQQNLTQNRHYFDRKRKKNALSVEK